MGQGGSLFGRAGGLRRTGVAIARALAGIAFAVAAGAAAAESADPAAWPPRPVKVIVPFAPGGPDVVARLIAQQLTARLGRPFVVENRPGANGIIGADLVAKAAADGCTLLITSSSIVVNPSVHRSLPFDTARDFTPVTDLTYVDGLVLTVHPDLPAHSLGELIEWGRRSGSRIAYGSPGVGNQIHVASALFARLSGLDLVHVPYKGAGPAMSALVGGEIQMLLITPPMSLPYVRAGKARALAYTAATRAAFLPAVPTAAESGLPGFVIDGGWYGLFAPAGLPASLLEQIYRSARAALEDPATRERIVALGVAPSGRRPEEFRALFEADLRRYAEVVRTAGITPE